MSNNPLNYAHPGGTSPLLQHPQPRGYPQQQQQQQQQQQPQHPQQYVYAAHSSGSPYSAPMDGRVSSHEFLHPPQLVSGPAAQLGLQLGSQMFNAGQDFVSKNISTCIPQGMLKTYFNVSNSYVLRKLLIILFPFGHKAWQRAALRDPSGRPNGFQPPRLDINSPDLYIPTMATVTYILLVGVLLGLRKAFHPHQLGVTASAALIFIVCELVLVKLGAYLLSLGNDVYIIDMLAIIGYNFVPLIVTMLAGLCAGRMAKWLAFSYCGVAMGFFMLRSLRYSFLPDSSSPLVVNQRRTRVLFLFGIVCVQILCSSLLLL